MTILLNSLNINHSIYSNPLHKSVINRYKAELYLKDLIEFQSITITTNHCCDCNNLNNNSQNCPITSIYIYMFILLI